MQFKSILEADNIIYISEIEELLESLSAIYYDITLSEMINYIKGVINIKKKYIKYINIQIEPSFITNINYERYENFFIKTRPMPLDLK